MSGPREEPRTAVMILVEALWLDQSGTVQALTARMEDRSEHGACIRMKARVAVGKRLYIQSHREQFSGVAKYCRTAGNEFLVGIHRDAVNSPAPRKPAPVNVPVREPRRLREAAVAPAKRQNAPRQQANAQSERRDAEWMAGRKAEPRRDTVPDRDTTPKVVTEEGTTLRRDSMEAYRAPSAVAREYIARIEEPIAARLLEEDARSREIPVNELPPIPPRIAAEVAPQVQREKNSERRPAKKGRGIMKLKWFAGDEEETFGANGSAKAPSEPAQRATEAATRLERGLDRAAAARPTAVQAAESGGGFETELLPVEDIYRAAGITSPRRGYSVTKVVEMLRSEHLRGASRELRRAAVLMALDAAGVTVDEVLQDAKVRQEAIDAYAMEQRKHAESQWARKAEENLQIQAELELVKAHYGERIRRNLDGVAREKATFGSWLKAKEQETQEMAEAVEQVLKAPGMAEAAADPLLSVTVSSATGKPV